jgi:hypothetical protein
LELKDHVIIIGYGNHGKIVSKTCAQSNIRCVVVEINNAISLPTPNTVDNLIVGDGLNNSILLKAGITKAKALIISTSNLGKIRKIIRLARKFNPTIAIQIRKDIYKKYYRSEKNNTVFCTAVNCMDGRLQLPVINFLKQRFYANYVDMITEPGPSRILSELSASMIVNSIISRIDMSIQKHSSGGIAVVGHHDCEANPYQREEQISNIQKSVIFLKERFPNVEIIGLWVDQDWQVCETETQIDIK